MITGSFKKYKPGDSYRIAADAKGLPLEPPHPVVVLRIATREEFLLQFDLDERGILDLRLSRAEMSFCSAPNFYECSTD